MNEPTLERGLSPVQALKRIDLILCDRRLRLAERVAAVGVVLRASRQDATAYPGFRFLCQRYGLGATAVARALAVPGGKAVGDHLAPAGRGPRGVQRFKVLPPPDPDSPEGSATPTGALKDGQRYHSEPPALPAEAASATGKPPQRSRHGSVTHVTHGTQEEDSDPPPSSLRADSNGNNGGGDAWLFDIRRSVTGQPASDEQPRAFLVAVREARDKGATEDQIADHIRKAGPAAAVWIGPNAAREEAKALLADFAKLDIKPRRKTVAEVLMFVDFCAEQLGDPEADGEAAATWRRVADWAEAHAEALRRPAGRAAR